LNLFDEDSCRQTIQHDSKAFYTDISSPACDDMHSNVDIEINHAVDKLQNKQKEVEDDTSIC